MIVAQVQAQTNLITQGAMDLAMNSGYDLASAAIRFEEVKVSVTSGAGFVRGGFANSARISFGTRIGSDPAGIVQAVSRKQKRNGRWKDGNAYTITEPHSKHTDVSYQNTKYINERDDCDLYNCVVDGSTVASSTVGDREPQNMHSRYYQSRDRRQAPNSMDPAGMMPKFAWFGISSCGRTDGPFRPTRPNCDFSTLLFGQIRREGGDRRCVQGNSCEDGWV